MKKMFRFLMLLQFLVLLFGCKFYAKAEFEISSPSAILIEKSTGKIIYEKNSRQRRSPASITKIMTLLIAMEELEAGNVQLSDDVIVSEYASSMGGSQVFLAQGEVQSLDTMLKCIAVASGNDASVAVAEHICGSEEAFVNRMNERALELGMYDTHFEDCCGLTDSDNHFTTAMDVAIMSRELIQNHPKIYDYTQIWMDEITHHTRQGDSVFGLSSTNKLLKQYQWTTGLKTGSTQKAKYCISATAQKGNMDLIAVVMGAKNTKLRFSEAQALLTYGFSVCRLYVDEDPPKVDDMKVKGGKRETVPIVYRQKFTMLDTENSDFSKVEKKVELEKKVVAPIARGEVAGKVKYYLNDQLLGEVDLVYDKDVERASMIDYLVLALGGLLLSQ